MTHRDKSLWPHITSTPITDAPATFDIDIEVAPGVIVIDHKLPTSTEMRAEMRRAIAAGERLGASHNRTVSEHAMTAAELGTAMHMEIERQRAMWGEADEVEEPLITGHYHIGDSHIGMGREELNRQLLAYANSVPTTMMLVGGDYLHGEPHPADVVMVIDGELHHMDYKLTEERVLQHMMHAEQAAKYLNKAIDNVAEPKVVKPTHGRSKDWEQRNRKRRR